MDPKNLKEWFANRKKKQQEESEAKQPVPNPEDFCALWKKCVLCNELLYEAHLRSNLHVCPKCQYHFRIGALERIHHLADPESFQEIDSELASKDPLNFVDTDTYPNKQKEATRKSNLREAIVTGTCTIQGAKTALGCMDFGHFGGSMGSVVGEKVTRLIEHAQQEGLPLIIVSSSGGARMQEGIFSLMQLAKTSSALQSFKEAGLLYISLLAEPTFGGVTASFAMLGDIIIAEPGARIGFAGARVIEQTIRQKLPKDFQTAEYLLKHGQIDMVVERTRLPEVLARLIDFHQPVPKKEVTVTETATKKQPTRATVTK